MARGGTYGTPIDKSLECVTLRSNTFRSCRIQPQLAHYRDYTSQVLTVSELRTLETITLPEMEN
jgi:hypothetical protein